MAIIIFATVVYTD